MVPGHAAVAPLHAMPAPQPSPTVPAAAMAQVPFADEPSAVVHTSHPEPHAVLQHTPSEALLLTHALDDVLGCPFFSAQALLPLHVEVLGQLVCGSVLTRAALHTPLVPPLAWSAVEQAWHVGHDAVAQQTLSKHAPAAHSRQPFAEQSPRLLAAAVLHAIPWARWAWQVLSPPQ